jgi:hypothetical protein
MGTDVPERKHQTQNPKESHAIKKSPLRSNPESKEEMNQATIHWPIIEFRTSQGKATVP